MEEYKKELERYGKFFYRFPHGEFAADVYDRISGDDVQSRTYYSYYAHEIVQMNGEQVENLINPKNAEVQIMDLGFDSEYSLAFEKWGLSPQMIVDQMKRDFGPNLD
ncbi:hypothetical protein RND71_015733 [Anisodus tanguticus]|uniref:Uncharacterized protein n=1 Tax=Anisodus tanguticus TaxID=243964 RepID=A0AAE1VLD2_9SOLA|nr:hypothetical protein RND71_015733 [Anisodus tanguticus]